MTDPVEPASANEARDDMRGRLALLVVALGLAVAALTANPIWRGASAAAAALGALLFLQLRRSRRRGSGSDMMETGYITTLRGRRRRDARLRACEDELAQITDRLDEQEQLIVSLNSRFEQQQRDLKRLERMHMQRLSEVEAVHEHEIAWLRQARQRQQAILDRLNVAIEAQKHELGALANTFAKQDDDDMSSSGATATR
jgi:hypothetical protein